MSKMLEFVGYNGKPILVARDKIMAVSDANE